MNREIKFRAWHDKYGMKHLDVLALTECTWSCPDYGKFGVSIPYQPSFKIMQYTGLKDENNVDVYEGDVVSDIYGTHVVEWNDDKCKWQRSDNGHDINDNKYYGISRRVIGNIFENPELLTP